MQKERHSIGGSQNLINHQQSHCVVFVGGFNVVLMTIIGIKEGGLNDGLWWLFCSPLRSN